MSDPAPSTRAPSERRLRKAAQRKRLFIWSTILILLVALLLEAKPLYRLLKERRADQLAAEAEGLVRDGNLNEAASKYRAALQLDPLGYRSLTGAARLATKGGRPEAIELWAEVLRLPDATPANRQEYATLLLQRDAISAAERIIADLLRIDPDVKTLSLAAQFSMRTGSDEKAVQYARLAIERAPDDDTLRFQLADFLAKSLQPAKREEARQILWLLAGKDGPSRKAAVEALARAPELSRDEQERVLFALNELPQRGIVTDLLSVELRLRLEPEAAAEIFAQTTAQWAEGEARDVAELARWLNLHKQSDRVLNLLPVERALNSDAFLLSRLDALANLGRWKEIDALLEHPDLTLDPAVAESFRARNAMGQNSTLDAELHWERALSLAGGDPLKLRFVANIAEQSRAAAVALKAYDQLARNPEHAAFAQRGRQRLIEQSGDTTASRAVAERLAAVAPEDVNAQAQLVHLNLLLGVDVKANLEKARALVAKYPARLSFRVSAALGFLRQNDPGSALAQFQGPAPIEWSRTPPAWRAVYAAVLAENDRIDEALRILTTTPLDRVTKEERELVAKIGAGQ